VRAQLPAVVAAQRAAARVPTRAARSLLSALVALSAATVTVEFYIAALPLLIWSSSPGAALSGLRLVGLLATSGYAAYALKDLLASPRPGEAAARCLAEEEAKGGGGGSVKGRTRTPELTPSRRSGRLAAMQTAARQEEEEEDERRNGGSGASATIVAAARSLVVRDHGKDVEDGAPSSHVSLSLPMTLHALALLWPLWSSASPVTAGSATALPRTPVLAALVWVVFVGWSRLYLGVHAPVDLYTGAALGHLSLAAWQGPVEQAWLGWALGNATAASSSSPSPSLWPVPLAATLAALLAMRMHPVPTRPTACFTYSTAFVGAGLGATLGMWAFAPRLLALSRVEGGGAAGAGAAATASLVFLLKAAAGLAAVLGTRAAVKAALLAALPPLMDLAPWSVRSLWQPPPADAALLATAGGGMARRRASASLPPRRPDTGVAYDVDAAARLGSYTAAVFVVVAHAALWPEAQAQARMMGWFGGV
jgi:membrane-associated phospholipid phosphatase